MGIASHFGMIKRVALHLLSPKATSAIHNALGQQSSTGSTVASWASTVMLHWLQLEVPVMVSTDR